MLPDLLATLPCPQEHVLQLVRNGANVFYTGGPISAAHTWQQCSTRSSPSGLLCAGNAGTGKTFLLQKIIAELKKTHASNFSQTVAITATTGIAATHVQGALAVRAVSLYRHPMCCAVLCAAGTTLHSALGIAVPAINKDFG